MSQTTVIKENSESKNEVNSEISIVDILSEIQAIPQEYWPNLCKLIKIFQETVTLTCEKQDQLLPEDKKLLIGQHKALKELTKQWIEEGDEQEQTETYAYLVECSENIAI